MIGPQRHDRRVGEAQPVQPGQHHADVSISEAQRSAVRLPDSLLIFDRQRRVVVREKLRLLHHMQIVEAVPI